MKILLTLVTLCATVLCQAQADQPTTSMAKSLGLYVFPKNKQSAETQSKDEYDCYQWAVGQTGVDPVNPPKVEAAKVDTSPDGTAVVGAAKGAAAGVAIGAIAGDAGKGAAIGAVAGGLAGRRAKKVGDAQQQQKNEQAAQQQTQALMNDFKKAFSACLEGKSYTVK